MARECRRPRIDHSRGDSLDLWPRRLSHYDFGPSYVLFHPHPLVPAQRFSPSYDAIRSLVAFGGAYTPLG